MSTPTDPGVLVDLGAWPNARQAASAISDITLAISSKAREKSPIRLSLAISNKTSAIASKTCVMPSCTLPRSSAVMRGGSPENSLLGGFRFDQDFVWRRYPMTPAQPSTRAQPCSITVKVHRPLAGGERLPHLCDFT